MQVSLTHRTKFCEVKSSLSVRVMSKFVSLQALQFTVTKYAANLIVSSLRVSFSLRWHHTSLRGSAQSLKFKTALTLAFTSTFSVVKEITFSPLCISRVPDQNGVSQAWYVVEIHHSGQEPSKNFVGWTLANFLSPLLWELLVITAVVI